MVTFLKKNSAIARILETNKELRQRINALTTTRWRRYKEDKIAHRFLKDKEKILDIGCGDGYFMQWFRIEQITGIDTNDESLEKCRQKGLNVIKMDALNIDFEEKFDGIHCSHILEHFYPRQLYKFLQSIDEILLPGASLIIRAPLLWEGFYDDLTHIRPYNPHVFVRYLCGPQYQKTTYHVISTSYKVEKIVYRYLPLVWIKAPKNILQSFLRLFFDILAYAGIHSFKKDAYIIILRKSQSSDET